MENFFDVLGNDKVYVVRLLVAMVLGGLVGIERQTRGRSAGLRTNILVCLGSAAIIVAFQKLSLELNMGAESAIRDHRRVEATLLRPEKPGVQHRHEEERTAGNVLSQRAGVRSGIFPSV